MGEDDRARSFHHSQDVAEASTAAEEKDDDSRIANIDVEGLADAT